MKGNSENWLPHLENAIPTKGFSKKLSGFAIGLEGWRRGLELEIAHHKSDIYKARYYYSLSLGDKKYTFASSKGEVVSDEAYRICDDKALTKKYLKESNIPTPEGKEFSVGYSIDEIIKTAKEIGFPVVLKPLNENGGQGVFVNIETIDRLKTVISVLENELGFKEILIEKFISGEEYRVVVIENEVVGAMHRDPANVIGDGKTTLEELIIQKNNIRKKNPHLNSRLIKLDKELIYYIESIGLSLSATPRKNQKVYLKKTSNLTLGGDSIIISELNDNLKEIAINATKAIPNLNVSGVDMIVDTNRMEAVVIEVNASPGLGGHLFPVVGEAEDIPKAMIDHCFPETKEFARSNLYVDFDNVLSQIRDGGVKSLTILPPEKNVDYSKKFKVYGNVQGVGYRKWVKTLADKLKIHGYVKNISDGSVSVVAASSSREVLVELESKLSEGPKKAIVEKVRTIGWTKPVNVGFDIKENSTTLMMKLRTDYEEKNLELNEIHRENNKLKIDYKKIKKERDKIKEDYIKFKNSRFWKASAPFRNVLDYVKKF
ncbi:acylphosphatase [Salipaludibacillus sp. HK11]|uniref:acylphosphatase n=1 Tax=Salipaludibacillus sp. HK11 TaxID=3394320 RepID=UPI0039FC8F2C